MKEIIIEEQSGKIPLSEIRESENRPIFAKREGILRGMVVNEREKGWITRTGGTSGASGHHPSLRQCLLIDSQYGYKFDLQED